MLNTTSPATLGHSGDLNARTHLFGAQETELVTPGPRPENPEPQTLFSVFLGRVKRTCPFFLLSSGGSRPRRRTHGGALAALEGSFSTETFSARSGACAGSQTPRRADLRPQSLRVRAPRPRPFQGFPRRTPRAAPPGATATSGRSTAKPTASSAPRRPAGPGKAAWDRRASGPQARSETSRFPKGLPRGRSLTSTLVHLGLPGGASARPRAGGARTPGATAPAHPLTFLLHDRRPRGRPFLPSRTTLKEKRGPTTAPAPRRGLGGRPCPQAGPQSSDRPLGRAASAVRTPCLRGRTGSRRAKFGRRRLKRGWTRERPREPPRAGTPSAHPVRRAARPRPPRQPESSASGQSAAPRGPAAPLATWTALCAAAAGSTREPSPAPGRSGSLRPPPPRPGAPAAAAPAAKAYLCPARPPPPGI